MKGMRGRRAPTNSAGGILSKFLDFVLVGFQGSYNPYGGVVKELENGLNELADELGGGDDELMEAVEDLGKLMKQRVALKKELKRMGGDEDAEAIYLGPVAGRFGSREMQNAFSHWTIYTVFLPIFRGMAGVHNYLHIKNNISDPLSFDEFMKLFMSHQQMRESDEVMHLIGSLYMHASLGNVKMTQRMIVRLAEIGLITGSYCSVATPVKVDNVDIWKLLVTTMIQRTAQLMSAAPEATVGDYLLKYKTLDESFPEVVLQNIAEMEAEQERMERAKARQKAAAKEKAADQKAAASVNKANPFNRRSGLPDFDFGGDLEDDSVADGPIGGGIDPKILQQLARRGPPPAGKAPFALPGMGGGMGRGLGGGMGRGLGGGMGGGLGGGMGGGLGGGMGGGLGGGMGGRLPF